MFTDFSYEPTSEDLKDWHAHLSAQEYGDDFPTDKQLQDWNELNDYTNEEEDHEEDNEPDPGEMDGDHTSALTSAGHGTDEDYGYFGGNEYDF